MLYSMKISADFLDKGALVSANAFLLSIPGAPIYNMDYYKKKYIRIENQIAKKALMLKKFCLPFNKKVENLINKLEIIFEKEIKNQRKNSPWQKGIVPKVFSALVLFIAISKELKRNDYKKYFE